MVAQNTYASASKSYSTRKVEQTTFLSCAQSSSECKKRTTKYVAHHLFMVPNISLKQETSSEALTFSVSHSIQETHQLACVKPIVIQLHANNYKP